MEAAIFTAAVCVPLSVLVWRLGGLWLQSEFLAYRREGWKAQAELTSKQAHELQASLAARLGALEASVGVALDEVKAIKTRIEQGREVVVRKVG